MAERFTNTSHPAKKRNVLVKSSPLILALLTGCQTRSVEELFGIAFAGILVWGIMVAVAMGRK